MTNYAIEPTLTEQQNVIDIPDNKEILTSALILEKNPEALQQTEETPINNTPAEIIMETKSLEKLKVMHKFHSYQKKLAEKAKAAEPVKEEIKFQEPEIAKAKTKQSDKKKAITKTTKKEPVKSKPPVIQKTNEIKPKDKTQIKTKPLPETKTSEKKAAPIKQMETKKVVSKQLEKQVPVSKQSENQAMATIHSDECLENTKQQIKVTKIQTYLRPQPVDEMLNKPQETKIFENLPNIKKVEVTGQTKSSGEARYIKLSAEREAVETSILETLESRRLKEENMPLGLGVAARNAAEMAMHVEAKQLVEKEYKDVEEIIEEVMYENQIENADKNIFQSSDEEAVVTHPANKVETAKQVLKEKCQIFGKLKRTEENKEDETKQSDEGITKTKQVLKESWQKVKSKKTQIEEGKHTVTKQLDDKLGLTQKWNKIYKQKTNKSSVEETDEEIVKSNPLEDNIEDGGQLTEDQIKAQQAIIRKILEECVQSNLNNQENEIEEHLEDLTIEAEEPEELVIEEEETEDDTIIADKKLTIAEKVDNQLRLKQKWENVCKLKDNIKGKVSKKVDEENQVSEKFHIKAQNVIKQKIQTFKKTKVSIESTQEIEKPAASEKLHIRAQNVIKQKLQNFKKQKSTTVEMTQEIEEPSLPIDDQPVVGWFNKEEVPENKELVKENDECEIKPQLPQFGWFNKEPESSLSMVGSPDQNLFNEVNMEQNDGLDEQTNENETTSQQFGWFSSEMEREHIEPEQEKEIPKGKWGKCRSMVSSVMRPMK